MWLYCIYPAKIGCAYIIYHARTTTQQQNKKIHWNACQILHIIQILSLFILNSFISICSTFRVDCEENKIIAFTFIKSSATLLAALVQVTTGTHEATDHSCYSSHKEQDRWSNAGYSGRAERGRTENVTDTTPILNDLTSLGATNRKITRDKSTC